MTKNLTSRNLGLNKIWGLPRSSCTPLLWTLSLLAAATGILVQLSLETGGAPSPRSVGAALPWSWPEALLLYAIPLPQKSRPSRKELWVSSLTSRLPPALSAELEKDSLGPQDRSLEQQVRDSTPPAASLSLPSEGQLRGWRRTGTTLGRTLMSACPRPVLIFPQLHGVRDWLKGTQRLRWMSDWAKGTDGCLPFHLIMPAPTPYLGQEEKRIC